MSNRRVVITGLGAVTPYGPALSLFWNALLEGRHGFAPIRRFDTAGQRQPNGAEVDFALLREALLREGLPETEPSLDMGLAAAAEALGQAGIGRGDGLPWPVIVGSALGCMHGLLASYDSFLAKGIKGIRPTALPRFMGNALSANISIRFGLTGPNYTVVSACASSSGAIGAAFRLVQSGAADGAVTGGADATFMQVLATAWNNLGILSAQQDPALCCRPFDAERNGTVLGEGAAMLVLEEREHARKRGAPILAEIAGFAENSDASHLANPSAEGQTAVILAALRDAGMAARDLGFVHAHGTGTIVSDRKESEALRAALGAEADRIPVVSLKSYIGHTQGACGALETAAAVMTLRDGRLPGNRNLATPDPACPIRAAGRKTESIDRPAGLKTCFGFGGHNTALVLRAAE
jgi:3-oxoacyl-(acyl-carrier-protein) synthase